MKKSSRNLKAVPKKNKIQEWIEEQSKVKYQPEPVTERYTSTMKEFEESEKEQRKMTPSPRNREPHENKHTLENQ